jgi:hypothetical protein
MTAPVFDRARQRGAVDKVGQPNPMGLFEAMTTHVLDAEIANTVLFLASDSWSLRRFDAALISRHRRLKLS